MDVSVDAEVGGIDDFVRRRVGEDGFGVDASFVGEGAEAGDGVVEGDVDGHGFRDKLFDLLDLLELVLADDIVAVGGDHARHQAAEGGDAVALADAEDGSVDVGDAGFQGAVGVGDSAAGVVVQVDLDVAGDDATKGADEVIDLSRRRAADCVSDADPVDADAVDGLVEGEEVDNVGAEGVFGGEADFDALRLDKLDDFDGGVLDIGHVFAVGVLAEEGGGADDDVDAVHSCFDSDSGVFHITADMGEDLALEAELADRFTVLARLLRGGGGGELDVVGTKLVESFGDLDLLVGVEVGIGEPVEQSVHAASQSK